MVHVYGSEFNQESVYGLANGPIFILAFTIHLMAKVTFKTKL